ncbi:ATP synthase F1, delta subunit [Phytophthora cinnamomi]|uniref:ATP synthase F1, delta subunit n=1 Tax=Phytophthora cinnamomi TaxID=4785 RepID=UPI00355A5BB9|nr:ATP synthase F1, delta subunit [Phytophthora cinnamomi]
MNCACCPWSATIEYVPSSLDHGYSDAVAIDEQQQTISVVTNTASGGGTSFRFDQVLSPNIDQAGVFRLVASDVVDGALSGYNGCILAYGQTGAGKTFTMSGGGPRRRFEDRGLIARSLSRVFQRTQQDADHSYTLRMSYLEIYNDRLIDLLAPDVGSSGTCNASNDLAIQENARGQTFVRGLTTALVSSEEQALDLVFQGDTSRAVAEHALNAASTRSHCIFTLYLERKRSVMSTQFIEGDASGDEASGSRSHGDDDVVYSKLHLVDLAGSERMKKTMTESGSTRANEACYINRSLTFLEQVVLALSSKTRAHVPFRQTPLTNLLKDSLGGNCRTLLVACVWPAPTHADQSLATLRFAARMRRVKTQAVVNVVASGSGAAGSKLASEERAAYRDEIRRLREELALYDAIAGQTRVLREELALYDAIAGQTHDGKESAAEEERSRRQQITAFLDNAELVPPVESLRQVQRLLHTFRSLCLDMKGSAVPAPTPTGKTGSKMVAQIRALRGHTPPGPSPSSAPSSTNCSSKNSKTDGAVVVLPPIFRDNQRPERDHQQEWQGRQERGASAPAASEESDKELFDRWNGSMLSSTIKNSVRKAAVTPTLTRGLASAASSTKEVEEIGGFGQMTQPKLQLFGLHARYANALYSVAAKQNQLESVEKELLTIEETIAKEPNFASFLHDPTIARASKKEDIAKVMEKAKFSKPVAGLFEVLAENGRLPDAAGVISAYKKLMGAYRGEVQAKVTSADPLTKAQLDQVKKALGARVEKNEKLLLETVVDPEILGGLKVQIGNYFIDLSLATKIDKINTLLANSSQQ